MLHHILGMMLLSYYLLLNAGLVFKSELWNSRRVSELTLLSILGKAARNARKFKRIVVRRHSSCKIGPQLSSALILLSFHVVEGSVEVKLPTIWTDEKQSRAEAERRERLEERRVEEKESEERRCRCAKR